jgi:hypothetical protein
MRWRILLTLALLGTSASAWAEPARSASGPALRWEGPDDCRPGDLIGHVAELVGLDRERLASKLVRVFARVNPRPEGDWRAQLDIETSAGSGERAFEAEDCRSLVDGIALIVALAVDPTVQVPQVPAVQKPAPPGPDARDAGVGSAARATRPRLLLRPLLGAEVGTLPEVSLAYGLAVGVAWSHLRLEADGKTAASQEKWNASGHGARLRALLSSGGRACLQATPSGSFEPAACAGASVSWLRSTGLRIAQPETHDSLAVALTAGAALGLRLLDWLWLRAEGALALSVKRPRFEIEGAEEVYRVRLLSGFLGGGIELRF